MKKFIAMGLIVFTILSMSVISLYAAEDTDPKSPNKIYTVAVDVNL